jgi:hypothetical protein
MAQSGMLIKSASLSGIPLHRKGVIMSLLQTGRLVAASVLVLNLASSTVSAKKTRKPPKNPSTPLAVFVYSPGEVDKAKGEVLEGSENFLAIVSENVREEVKLERKWFRVVAEKSESEIQVQIGKQWGWRGTESNDDVGHYNPRSEHGVSRLPDSRKTQNRHYIEADLMIFGQVVETITATSITETRPAVIFRAHDIKHLLSAADLVRRLKAFCTDHYWEIKDTELLFAALEGDTAEVKALVDAGADAKSKDNDGVTALMWAVVSQKVDTVRFLLDAGADVNARASGGETALKLAADQEEILALLKKAGAKQ